MWASYRRGLKALGWLWFLASLWFVLDFTLTARERVSDIVEESASLADESTRSTQRDTVDALFVSAAAKLAGARAFYADRLAGRDEVPLPADLFDVARRDVVEARLRIASAEGAASGVFAQDPLDAKRLSLSTHLQRMNTSTGILNAFFDDYLTSGPTVALRRLKEREVWIGAEPGDVAALRLRAWDEQAARKNNAQSAEQALNRSIASFVRRLFVSTLGGMYCAAFLGILVWPRRQGTAGRPAA